MKPHRSNILTNPKYLNNPLLLFVFFWLATFILYLPASRAGLEGDFPYWAASIDSQSFWDFINAKGASLPFLHQFTQIVRYLFLSVWGYNTLTWHLLHISLNAIIALLLFNVFRKILKDSHIEHPYAISFGGVLLFCVTPHATEVVVREMCYHYLQGFIFILLIVGYLLRFLETRNTKYAWLSGIIFFISTFSLEIFYLTPWVVLLVIAYYRIALGYERKVCLKSVVLFFVPQIIMFFGHLVLLRIVWGNRIAHIGTLSFSNPVGLLSKPILYFFHIIFLGRYFPQTLKIKIYSVFESGTAVYSFYAIALLLFLTAFLFFSKLQKKIQAIILFALISIAFVFLAVPLDFATILYIIGDRYIYIPSAFTSIIFALLASLISYRPAAVAIFSSYLLLNVYYTAKTNQSTYYAATITKSLLTEVPSPGNKKILLLNLPACMNGALMIRAQDESEFKLMNNMFYPQNKINNEVYDVCGYNMQQPNNGAHVYVFNDSVLNVTLNQWGAWWWRGDLGAGSYENKEYKLNMTDPGHWYQLILKHPASEYLILYQVGSKWKTVDWNKKNVDQN